jgi:hypothetical protein
MIVFDGFIWEMSGPIRDEMHQVMVLADIDSRRQAIPGVALFLLFRAISRFF